MLQSTREILKKLDEISVKLEQEVGWRSLAEKLLKDQDRLLDRLAARDLPELKTYTFLPPTASAEPYDPMSDANLSGTVMKDETEYR